MNYTFRDASRDFFAYEKIDAEEAPDLVQKYGIRQAPTLVVVKDGKTEVFANASNIIGYINENE